VLLVPSRAEQRVEVAAASGSQHCDAHRVSPLPSERGV
jgi:hypothetical protein